MTQEQYEAALATEFGPDAPAILQAYPTAEYGSPKDALAHAVTDAEYACGSTRLSRLVERTNTAVYLYQFEYSLDVLAGRAVHGLDVSFVFGTTVAPPVLPPPSTYPLSPGDLDLFRSIAGYWRRFADTGNPNVDDDTAVHWQRFNRPADDGRGADKYLMLDRPIRAEKRLREAQCAFWEPYFFRSITAAVPAHTQ
jgi:carboxylesterase type B